MNSVRFRDVENADIVKNIVAGQRLLRGMNKGHGNEVGKATPFTTGLLKARGNANRRNPIVPNMADYVNWYYYDRITYAAGATIPTQFQLFVIPYNTGGKTKADTNMQLASQLPQPYWLNLTSIGFSWNTDALLSDIQAFLNQSWFEFICNDKVYCEGKLEMYPSGSGLSGVSTDTAQQTFSNGQPKGPMMQYDLRLPAGINLGSTTDAAGNQIPAVTDGLTGITILQSQIFKVNFYLANTVTLAANNATPNPGAGFNPTMYLGGVLSRSVS